MAAWLRVPQFTMCLKRAVLTPLTLSLPSLLAYGMNSNLVPDLMSYKEPPKQKKIKESIWDCTFKVNLKANDETAAAGQLDFSATRLI